MSKAKAKSNAKKNTPAGGRSTKRIQQARKSAAKPKAAPPNVAGKPVHKRREDLVRVELTDKGMRETQGVVSEPISKDEVLVPINGNGVSGAVVVQRPAGRTGWAWFDFVLVGTLISAVLGLGYLAWEAWP